MDSPSDSIARAAAQRHKRLVSDVGTPEQNGRGTGLATPLRAASPAGEPMVLTRLAVELEDGRTGWYQRTPFECLRASVATLLELDYDDVPHGLTIHELTEAWAPANGWRAHFHLPMFEWPAGWWLGIDQPLRYGPYGAHAIVGRDDGRLMHDPASGWVLDGGGPLPPRPIGTAITFKPQVA